mgnify:CR=1 FL=1
MDDIKKILLSKRGEVSSSLDELASVVKDILKAHEYFRSKNVKVDLVILNREENSYDQYVNYEIENAILNRQVEYLKNISGGIFVLNINQIDKEDIDLLEYKANLTINAKEGDINTAIKDLEEEYLKTVKNIGLDTKLEYIIGVESNFNFKFDILDFCLYNVMSCI